MRSDPATAVILGAAGQMGCALSEVLSASGIRNIGVDLAAAPQSGFEPLFAGDILALDATKPSIELSDALAQADVVVMAIPLGVGEAALRNVSGHLRPGALIVETFSVKEPAAALAGLVLPGYEFLGINPLFAPSLRWANRPVLVVAHRNGPACQRFIAWLEAAGATTASISAADHDVLLARRQGAAHAAIIAFGAVLMAELGSAASGRIEPPLSFGPPPYQLMLMLLARILDGDPHVYAEIQALNANAADVRAQLREALNKLDGSADNVAAAIEAMGPLKALLGPAAQACNALMQEPLLPEASAQDCNKKGR
jgi:prephenate dehydrogenase